MRTFLFFFFPGFSGRVSRAHVWAAIAMRLILCVFFIMLLAVLDVILIGFELSPVEVEEILFYTILGFICLQVLSGLMLGFCRLHNAGVMGIPALLVLIPPIGWLPLLFLYVMPGDKAANEYGEPDTLFQ